MTQGDSIMKIADKNEFEKQNVFGTGTPNTAYAKYFGSIIKVGVRDRAYKKISKK